MASTAQPIKRGALVAIEGLDRAGKSTQCRLLLERFQERRTPVYLQKFPDRTTAIGKMIDSYLQSSSNLDDHAIHLLFSANRWELSSHIQSLIANGTTVILDRYVYSGIVFTAAKGLDVEYCRGPDVGLPRPDAVVFLDLGLDEAKKRGGWGEERYENEGMQMKVRGLFGVLKDDGRDAGDWRVVDAGACVEEVREEVWRVIEEALVFAGANDLRRIL